MHPIQIDNAFTFHPVKGDQGERYQIIRDQAREYAKALTQLCPESPERSTAVGRLREVVMWANASIACNE